MLFGAGLLIPALLVLVPGCRPAARPAADPPNVTAPSGRTESAAAALVSAGALEEYAGSRECVSCHSRYAEQLESQHARTLAKVDVEGQGKRFRSASRHFDPVAQVTYETGVQEGRCVLVASRGPQKAAVAAEYAFGSGNRGVTYVGRYAGHPVELRLSHYRHSGGWDFTPGQEVGKQVDSPVGRVLDRETLGQCFGCHVTALATENGEIAPARSIAGVGCEGCHGPGRAHIRAVKQKEADLKMVRLSQARDRVSKELCGRCHQAMGGMAGTMGGSAGGPPGPTANPTELPAAAPHPTVPEDGTSLARHQGAALMQSACFLRSGKQLSCVTCHDPHRDADRISLAEYDRRCLSCHRGTVPDSIARKTCPVQPERDCVSCHMPAQTVGIPAAPKFRNHWIKVWEKSTPERVQRTGR